MAFSIAPAAPTPPAITNLDIIANIQAVSLAAVVDNADALLDVLAEDIKGHAVDVLA